VGQTEDLSVSGDMDGDDPSRAEFRAMVLIMLPYPPLPVLAAGVEKDDGRLQDDELITTHTLIARALDESMARNCASENEDRKKRQVDVLQRFLHTMATDGFFCGEERLYQIYCYFSLEHIATYFPVGHLVDIRFQPLSSVAKGDKVHSKMAEYMASQSVAFEDTVRVRRHEYAQQDYVEMLRGCRDRLGHGLTDDERARVHQLAENSSP
jgi:hypothetical protein